MYHIWVNQKIALTIRFSWSLTFSSCVHQPHLTSYISQNAKLLWCSHCGAIFCFLKYFEFSFVMCGPAQHGGSRNNLLFFWSVLCNKRFSWTFWDFQASWRSYSLVCDVRSRLVSSYWPHGPFSVLLFSKSVKTLLGGMKPFFQKIFPYLGPKSPQVFSWDLVTVKA